MKVTFMTWSALINEMHQASSFGKKLAIFFGPPNNQT